ncbi:hypothetical protein LSCM1_01786 [Leishmania martiniquensis]|uniref:DNA 3'-5' helicase n=1 Tax=Leishmania martiniquensis TaxID=1580590 RepID=A0A836KFB3_9TRYP|nr:hypothetical protein LSCM1_01786 [Leishmania martiniquensis]
MSTPAAKCLGELLDFLPHHRFTKVQEVVVPALFTNDHNCLVAAPTGSGKTMLLEVAMLRLFRHFLAPQANIYEDRRHRDGRKRNTAMTVPQRKWKAVYICPIKALASEKYEHWRAQFPTLTVVVETGDQQQQANQQEQHSGAIATATGESRARDGLENMACVSKADILVTTPERWDSITRRWKEKEVMAIVNSVGLLLLDEVHTVQEERGAAMEAIVSRVKVIQASSTAMQQNSATEARLTRIIAISGTLPNSRDLAEWLQVSPEMTFTFAPTDRPVPLTIRVIGYAHDSPNPFAFHRFLSFKLFSLVQQFSQGRPTLVFCASRKETISSAQRIVEDIRDAAARQGRLTELQPSAEAQQLTQQASDKQLRSCLMMGVGFHHAAMTKEDRQLVERMFREEYIAVICATTTLALGVNLPVHLVLVKGTNFFSNGQCQDMPVSEVMQMCGRAGRPGFDTHGMALVLTTQRSVHLYETLASGAVTLTCVESHLHCHMIEHVNAEVALRTIHSFSTAMDWVKTTFFWIRLRKFPSHYGLQFANRAEEVKFNAEAFVEALLERVLRVLMEEGCVRLSGGGALALSSPHETGAPVATSDIDYIKHPSAVFEATRLGRAMSRMYILFDTVCTLNAKVKNHGAAILSRGAPDDNSGVDSAPGAVDVGEATAAQKASARVEQIPNGSEVKMDSASEGAPPPSDSTGATVCVSKQQVVPFHLREVLQLLCHCQELVEVRLRQGDRGPLNELNKRVKYPLNSGRRGGREVREDWQKAYVLIQAHVGLLPLTEVSLRNDSLRLWAVVPRVSRFLEEYTWAATTSYSLAAHANVLSRCIERRVWPDGLVLRQLKHVSDSVARALLRSGYQTFESVRGVDARQLEVLSGRLPPFGSQLLSAVRRLPRVSLDISFTASVAEGDGRRDGRPEAGGVVQLTLSSSAEATPHERLPDAAQRQLSMPASSKAPDVNTQEFVDEIALDSTRMLLLVGIPSEDRVLLKRIVPLSALRSQNATCSTSVAAPQRTTDERRPGTICFPFVCPPLPLCRGSGDRMGRRIEARCLVLRVVGMDTVTVRDEALAVNDESGASENMRNSAPKPATDACTPSSAPKETALLSRTSVPPTQLSVEVAAEARTAFNELLEDFKYIASVGEQHHLCNSTPRQSSASRKRPRGDQSVRLIVEERQQQTEVEGEGEKDMAATRVALFAVPDANVPSLVPDPSDPHDRGDNANAGAAVTQASQERAAADGSPPDSAPPSPEQLAGPAPCLAASAGGEDGGCHSPKTGAAAQREKARIRLRPRDSPPASRPPDAAGALSHGCFLAERGEVPYAASQAAWRMPAGPQGACDTPLYATVPANETHAHSSRCTSPWGGKWSPSMGTPAVPTSRRFVVRVRPPHGSAVAQCGDVRGSWRRPEHEAVGPQEAFYYPPNPHATPLDMRYAATDVQSEWCPPSWMQDPSWMPDVVTSTHPYPYDMPPMMVRPGHYGPILAWPSGVGHPQGHWEHVAAAPVSHVVPQHPPSFFASQPRVRCDEVHQQAWQKRFRLPSHPPTPVPSVSVSHQPSPLAPHTVLKTEPWLSPLPPSVYPRREWHPSPPTQPELALPSLWAPLDNVSQPQHFATMNKDWRSRVPSAQMPERRANVSMARPALMPTTGGGNFSPNVRRCSSTTAVSWWQ